MSALESNLSLHWHFSDTKRVCEVRVGFGRFFRGCAHDEAVRSFHAVTAVAFSHLS